MYRRIGIDFRLCRFGAAGTHSLLDAKIVTFVDADQARNSQFGQYLLKRTQSGDQNFEQFTQQTGFDPRRDLQSFLFESSGPAKDGSHGHWALLARGTFDQARIQAMATGQRRDRSDL